MSGIDRLLIVLLLAGCVGPVGPPALVLAVSHVSRRRATEAAFEERREVVVSAAVEVALDQPSGVGGAGVPVLPRTVWDVARGCEEARPLCAWAEREEHEAWLALLEDPEVVP